MKYLFIIQGEGRGHMTQAISLAQQLEQRGHEISSVLVGKSKGRDIPDFFIQKMGKKTRTFEEPSFIRTRNKKGVRLLPSILYNLIHIAGIRRQLAVLQATNREDKPDVIVNFYSILGGLFYYFNRPQVRKCCIAHQYMFLHPGYEFPKKFFFKRIMLQILTRITALNADTMLALSFYPKENLPKKNLFVVPPLLRSELFTLESRKEDYLLCYILNDGYREEIMHWQKEQPKQEIHLFGDGKRKIEETEVQPNLFWHQLNDMKFLRLLSQCNGYASTAGFESICEAMYLEKPILLIPTQGHIEQECNAYDAVQAGAGITEKNFALDKLQAYLQDYQPVADYKNWVHRAPILFAKHLNKRSWQDYTQATPKEYKYPESLIPA